MPHVEEALVFDCGGSSLIGVLSGAALAAERGVLIVVGGPQYRAGSHRQFTLLARHLAERGVPTLRFDYRGMGDSDGGYGLSSAWTRTSAAQSTGSSRASPG